MTVREAATRWCASKTRRVLGISPSELRLMLAILSHESAFGESPTRRGIAQLLGIQPNGYRLMHIGWIISHEVGPVFGQRLAVWKSSDLARQMLLGEAEERRSA